MDTLKLELNNDQVAELTAVRQASSLDYRYIKRATIILKLYEGCSYSQICSQMGIGRSTVSRWKERYRENGLEGLKDSPGRGRKSEITLEQRNRVINLACTKPDDGYTSYSQRRIAEKVGIAASAVNKILKENQLRPHKVEQWCGKSPDPEFEEKVLNIVGLYLSPDDNALVLSVDEKTQMQALDRTQEELPLMKGKPRRQTATYVRNGTVSIIAALAVHTGEVTAKTMERNTSKNFLSFLKKLDRKYTNKHLHIIVDNLAVHKEKSIKEWVQKKRKFTLHYTPTYSSWLNQIEIWFNILSKDVLKGGIWKSKKQLSDQILTYIKTYNENRAKPFSWTYDGTKKEDSSPKKSSATGIDILRT